MNKEENLSFSRSAEKHVLSQELQDLTPRNCVTVGRRSFIRGLGIVGATLLPAGALLIRQAKAREQSSGTLTKGDADLLRFAAWAEIVESDLWTRDRLPNASKRSQTRRDFTSRSLSRVARVFIPRLPLRQPVMKCCGFCSVSAE